MDFEKMMEKGVYRKFAIVKYKTTERHLLGYLQWQNAGRDVLLIDLGTTFASNFEYYLQAEKGLSINPCGKMPKNLKKVIRHCVDKDFLDREPFYGFKVRHVEPKVPHLSAGELKALEEKDIIVKRPELVSDLLSLVVILVSLTLILQI